MSINRKSPEIASLIGIIESKIGFKPATHEDFVKIREIIFDETKENISSTTLERVWGYSTRGYNNISLHTLNLLALFIGKATWDEFCAYLQKEGKIESGLFDKESISSDQLAVGQCILIGWQPNRKCLIKYLGNNRFVAEETSNSKLQSGDTFSCLQFQLGRPAYLEDLTSAEGNFIGKSYGIGLKNGLTSLQEYNQ